MGLLAFIEGLLRMKGLTPNKMNTMLNWTTDLEANFRINLILSLKVTGEAVRLRQPKLPHPAIEVDEKLCD